MPKFLSTWGPYFNNTNPDFFDKYLGKRYRTGPDSEKLVKPCWVPFVSFLILATWDFDDLKGASPLQKSHILQFRSCIFSEMRSRLPAKRYTIWWSKSSVKSGRSFYFTFADSAFEGNNVPFEIFVYN